MKWIIVFKVLFLSLLAVAQNSGSLTDFNKQRIKTSKNAMKTLGGWAIGNIGTSGALVWSAKGDMTYFHASNIVWGATNLSIAAIGLAGDRKAKVEEFDLATSIKGHYSSQKTFLFNAGLDVGYIMGGAYLMERSKNINSQKTADIMEGTGKSFILQGSFLLVFDFAVYFIKSKQNKHLENLMEGLSFSGNGLHFSLEF